MTTGREDSDIALSGKWPRGQKQTCALCHYFSPADLPIPGVGLCQWARIETSIAVPMWLTTKAEPAVKKADGKTCLAWKRKNQQALAL